MKNKNNNKNNFGHIYMAVSILFQDFHTLLFSNEVVIFIEHSTFERQKFSVTGGRRMSPFQIGARVVVV